MTNRNTLTKAITAVLAVLIVVAFARAALETATAMPDMAERTRIAAMY
ncbi:hypothetical protein T8A63_15140 [Sulfitobacter sp. OXR-159]|nr:hypothetical protein [Sulfitobacter sp. OXR-159]WPZ28950.1 hypothetical protein T8A63_15140 [Sulfitobacter sp. OXR-159]